MKRLIVIFSLLPLLAAANIEPLPSRLKVLKHSSWYQDKAVFWKRILDKQPDRAEAWFNYYFSLTYANAPSETRRKVAQTVLSRWPELYEAKLIAAKDLGFANEGRPYFEEVSKLRPDDPEVLSMGLLLAEITGNATEKSRIAKRLYDKQLISPSLYNYAYNLLMSVSDDAILFSEGEYTSVPMMVLQEVMAVKPDVVIVNTDLLSVPDYARSVTDRVSPSLSSERLAAADLLARVPQSANDRSFYYSMTLRKELLSGFDNQLNLTGLALKYVDDEALTIRELTENFSRFLTDYLVLDFNNEGEGAAGRVLEPNYLPGLIILKSHFEKTGQQLNTLRTERLITGISKAAGLTRKVQSILSPTDDGPVIYLKTDIGVKEIDQAMHAIRAPLYASETEVTNEQYYKFLSYLRNNGYKEQYEIARIDLRKFDEVALSSMKAYFRISDSKKKGEGNFNDYPVINISHEAAVLYCEWLTRQYNQQEKRKYQKVRFRLPTLKEWQIAALGYTEFQSWVLSENVVKADFPVKGRMSAWENKRYDLSEYTIDYPWYRHDWTFRNNITNQHECYLANVLDTPGKCPVTGNGDGWTMTSPVGTYFANGMKLYDVIGNVAEMLDEKGIAAGGSWAHTPEASTITSTSRYEGADVKVGFRVFMEVIEE